MDFFICFSQDFTDNIYIFLTVYSVQLVLFLVYLFFCIFKYNFTYKLRVSYLIISTISFIICKMIEKAYSFNFLSESLFIFTLISLLPMMYIDVKNIVVKSEEKTFIRKLDEEIIQSGKNEVLEKPILKVESIKEKPVQSLNYSHIKGLIQKLEFQSLSPIERNIVSNLQVSIFKSERGENSEENANEIKEGLSALLKIMAKYGA